MKYISATETHIAQLHDYFPESAVHIEALVAEPQYAPIPELDGQSVPYVRINEGASRPVFYAPGFGESVVNKLSFAAALAESGFEVIMPGQNRSGVMRDDRQENLAIRTQARNNVAVLEAAGTKGSVDVVAHSFGALVAPKMVEYLAESGQPTDEMSVALLAPAGVGYETSYRNLGARWLRMLKSEWGPADKAFPDTTGETGKASLRTLLANPRQSIAEVRSLRHDRIDFDTLCRAVRRVAVVCYADDEMFPETFLERGLPEALNAGAIALSPVSFGTGETGGVRRMPSAAHDDEQFNPWRVATPVGQFLRG